MPPIPQKTLSKPSPTAALAKGNTALITGGASGIGLAIAHLCRKKGMRVAVVDRNVELLDRAKKDLAYDSPEDVDIYEVDVSSERDWKLLATDVRGRFGKVDFLVLNAGIGGTGSWGDGEYFQKILGTNLFGVINGLNTFVPLIKAQTTPSAIVITGSKQGITNPPGNAAYNASKAAVRSLAEHLSYDLRDTSTSVHLLVPGWTFTGLSGGAPDSEKVKPDGAWTPGQVAEFLLKKMEEGKFYVLCPDNEVTEEVDRKRIMWTAGDLVYGRQPLSRWRGEYKEESTKWMEENSF